METEMEIEPHKEQPTISQHSTKLSRWIGEQVTILAEAFGESLTPQRVKIYAADLADIEQAQLALTFQNARRQCRFFPKIAELRELAGKSREQEQDAERRKAWDVLMGFVRKYVSNDVHGNYGPQYGWYTRSYPRLSDRILDTIRRTGSWKLYACMTDEDFPFVQKRFFEEYAAWCAVERIAPDRMLTTKVGAAEIERLAASKRMP